MSIFDYDPKRSILDPDLFNEDISDLISDVRERMWVSADELRSDLAYEWLSDAGYEHAVMGVFPCTPHSVAAGKPKADPLEHLRDLISDAAKRTARTPNRIRINEIVPVGMMIRAPYELDDSYSAACRTVDDGGPQEVIINPEDWEQLARPFVEHVNDSIDSIDRMWRPFGIPVNGLDRVRHATAYDDGLKFVGIPVFDDTIAARMRRAA